MNVFSMIQSLKKELVSPTGSPSKELARYDPVDKPILCYESLLFRIALTISLLAKGMTKLIPSETYWRTLRVIPLLLSSFVILVSLFHLLVPPRFSASRLAFLVIAAIMVLLLLSKN